VGAKAVAVTRINSTATRNALRRAYVRARRSATPTASVDNWITGWLKDPRQAAAYLEAALDEGDPGVLLLALRQVAQAHGGIAEIARRAGLTRESTYRILSENGNPELKSLTALLAAAGLRLSVKPAPRV
jgi:probable addiction module antidote protein